MKRGRRARVFSTSRLVVVDTDPVIHFAQADVSALLELPGEVLPGDRSRRTEGVEVHGSVGVVPYGYSQGALSGDTAERTLRELKQDTNLNLSTPVTEHAVELVDSDDAGW